MDVPQSPLPPRPNVETPPRGSWLAILLALMAAFAFAVILTFLTLGFIWPFVVGAAIFGVVGLQYLVWGWWFERIYRSQPSDADETTVFQFDKGQSKPPTEV